MNKEIKEGLCGICHGNHPLKECPYYSEKVGKREVDKEEALPSIVIEEKYKDDKEILDFKNRIPPLLKELPENFRNSIRKILLSKDIQTIKIRETERRKAGQALPKEIMLFDFSKYSEGYFFHEGAHVYHREVNKEYYKKCEKLVGKELQDFFIRFKNFANSLNIELCFNTSPDAYFFSELGWEEPGWYNFEIKDNNLVSHFTYRALPDGPKYANEWDIVMEKLNKFLEEELPKTYELIKEKIPKNFTKEWEKITDEELDEEFMKLENEGELTGGHFRKLIGSRVSRYGRMTTIEDVAEFVRRIYRSERIPLEDLPATIEELVNLNSKFYQKLKDLPHNEILKRKPEIIEQIASKYKRKLDLLKEFGFIP